MPKVHRFLRASEARAEARSHADAGLHLGIDFDDAASLFGDGWDREARDLGRHLRGLGIKVVARGPGWDLPLASLDGYVADQVRACHDRGLAAAMHLGCQHYLVRMGSVHGLSRSERLTRRQSASRMIGELCSRARARGLVLVVQHHLESDVDSLDLWREALLSNGGKIVLSPARAAWAGLDDVLGLADRCGDLLLGIDLTDIRRDDLEPRLPGTGVLASVPALRKLLVRGDCEFFCVDLPATAAPAMALVDALSRLVHNAEPSCAPAA